MEIHHSEAPPDTYKPERRAEAPYERPVEEVLGNWLFRRKLHRSMTWYFMFAVSVIGAVAHPDRRPGQAIDDGLGDSNAFAKAAPRFRRR